MNENQLLLEQKRLKQYISNNDISKDIHYNQFLRLCDVNNKLMNITLKNKEKMFYE